MGFVDQILKKLFNEKETEETQNPTLKVEAIQRSQQYNISYNKWVDSEELKSMLTNLMNLYYMVSYDDFASEDLVVMKRQGANGIICYGLNSETMNFLIDYFKEKTRALGYTLFNGDRKIHQKKDHFVVVERYFLKPHLSNQDFVGKRKQLYGNILLEAESKDEQPRHLKLLSTTYTDRNYEEAFPFDELIRKLLAA